MEHPITIECNRSINEGLSPITLDEDTNTENTIKINTEIIKNPINQSDAFELVHDENEIDQMDTVYLYRRLIKENIDYDIMMQTESWQERDMYNELYEIICDVVCIPSKIHIRGRDKTAIVLHISRCRTKVF